MHPAQHPLGGSRDAHPIADVPHERAVDQTQQHRPAPGHPQQPAGRLRRLRTEVAQQQGHGLLGQHRRNLDHPGPGHEVTQSGGDEPDGARSALQERLQLGRVPHVVDDQQPGLVTEQRPEMEAGLFRIGQGRPDAAERLAEIVDPVGESSAVRRLPDGHPEQSAAERRGDLRLPADLPGQGGLPHTAGAVQHDRPPDSAAPRRAREHLGENDRGERRARHDVVAVAGKHPRSVLPAGACDPRSAVGRGLNGAAHADHAPLALPQLHQGVEDRRLQITGAAEISSDNAGIAQPASELLLALRVVLVDEFTERNLGEIVQEEHQSGYPGLRRRVELQLGVGDFGPAGHQRAVTESDEPQVDVRRTDRPHAEVRRIGVLRTEVRHVDHPVARQRDGTLGGGDERTLPRKLSQLRGVAQKHPPFTGDRQPATDRRRAGYPTPIRQRISR